MEDQNNTDVGVAHMLLPLQADSLGLIRAIDVASGTVTTLAGQTSIFAPVFSDGTGTAATFLGPQGVALNSDGTLALVVRVYGGRIGG